MTITDTKRGNVTVVKVEGRLDSVTAPDFEKRLSELIDGGEKRIAVDCSTLQYVSSAGLRVFLSVAKKLRQAEGKNALGGLVAQVKEIFDIAGFSSVLSIFNTVAEAVKHCAG